LAAIVAFKTKSNVQRLQHYGVLQDLQHRQRLLRLSNQYQVGE